MHASSFLTHRSAEIILKSSMSRKRRVSNVLLRNPTGVREGDRSSLVTGEFIFGTEQESSEED